MPTALADRLNQELALWQQEGHRLRLWWRDDDAIAVTPALEKLLRLQQQFSVPLSLAVIAYKLQSSLSEGLKDYDGVIHVLQHGISHHNNALPDQKKIELGGSLIPEDCFTGLSAGYQTLGHHFSGLFVPVLVPPWNRLDLSLLPAVEASNFMALSVFGTKILPITLKCINTHLDIIDWTNRCFVGQDVLLEKLIQTAQDLRQQQRWHEPIGLLTHHLVHDEACWTGLSLFLAESYQNRNIDFWSIKQILDSYTQDM